MSLVADQFCIHLAWVGRLTLADRNSTHLLAEGDRGFKARERTRGFDPSSHVTPAQRPSKWQSSRHYRDEFSVLESIGDDEAHRIPRCDCPTSTVLLAACASL
jgi:hypothetical protein